MEGRMGEREGRWKEGWERERVDGRMGERVEGRKEGRMGERVDGRKDGRDRG